ncbi:ferredoxin [Candidatus Woesearchaeota archaeon]|jgi:ferredoxin|nr:ferredoxin [Candidatus Woesearchaeota archaeon]|tara:strand:- start:1194 stop:1421 length:228 start_codon:yes stop_codon:yes gene_type:complete
MAGFKIIYDRDACIGAAACAALDPERFEMNDDGKADLLKGKEDKPGLWILKIEELGEAQEAAESCPVDAIKIEEL